jgi:hypothetical protein
MFLYRGRGGATFVAPATEVAPACWPGLTRPTPHRGTLPVTFCRRGAAPFYRAYALQSLAIQVRRGNPSDWHRFCLSVLRGRGVPHAASETHRWRDAIPGGNRHTVIAVLQGSEVFRLNLSRSCFRRVLL